MMIYLTKDILISVWYKNNSNIVNLNIIFISMNNSNVTKIFYSNFDIKLQSNRNVNFDFIFWSI